MNSVGGIQVFAALKSCGTVLKTIPDFDALYEDKFWKNVTYYVSSASTGDQLEDVAFLDDVTLSTDAQDITNASVGGSAPEAQPAVAPVAQPAPVAAPVQAAPAAPVSPAPASEAPAAPAASASPAPEAKAGENKPAAAKSAAKPAAEHAQSAVLRVDSKRVDYLMNLVSETVITKAAFNQAALQQTDLLVQFQTLITSYKDKIHRMFEQMPQYLEQIQEGVSLKDIKANLQNDFGDVTNHFDTFEGKFKELDARFHSSTQNLGRIAGELQEGVMKIRMVPISQIFDRFPRVVRDLQKDLGKKINLIIEGKETELDKTVVDDLLDPLMHCVRNSCDHGIESPDIRREAGKDETGTVLLKAANEGNMIIIDIVDDGAGINVEKVRQKAIERGIIHPNKVI